MALEISMTGTGTVGDITPGWSVAESATPVSIGDNSAGTGTVSFTSRATTDSLLCINNNVVSTVGSLGTLSGVVQSVSESGPTVSITHGTVLDKVNLDVNMPPLAGGDVVTALDYFEQAVLGKARTSKTTGQFFTLAGHTYCYLNDGNGKSVFKDPISTPKTFIYDAGAGTGASYSYNDIRNIVSADNFARVGGHVYANGVNGNMLFSDDGFGTVTSSSEVSFKTNLNGGNTTFSFSGNPQLVSYDWEIDAVLTINHSAKTIAFSGTYAAGGSSTPISTSASIASLNVDAELAVFFYYQAIASNQYSMTAVICNTSNYSSTVVITQSLSFASTPVIDSWSIVGLVRDLFTNVNFTTPVPIVFSDYAIAPTLFQDNLSNVALHASAAFNGLFWQYLQMACSALEQEIAVIGDKIVVRNLGSVSPVSIDNVSASPTINPASTLSGKQINIAYTDAHFVDGVIYDAQLDGNNVISVEAGATTVTSVKWDIQPISIIQPYRYLATGTGTGATFTGPLPDGSYFIVDSTGLPISERQWEDYGGSLSVEIDHEDAAAIQITLIGPYIEIPSTTGPYSVAASTGDNEYGALKITGTGIYSGDGVLGLLTGIDPTKYTRATVNTITNPFIVDITHAYDRGIWAAQKASGPYVTMSATIPNSALNGIGLTCGSLINYRNSTYRITSCSIGSASTTINGERYVTVADIDALWSGKTVAQYDGVWKPYECQDQIVFPYKVA